MDSRTTEAKALYEGKHYFTNDNVEEFVILEYKDSNNVLIEFINSKHRQVVKMSNIRTGIANPFAKSCIIFKDPKNEFLGCQYKTNEGYTIKIIKCEGYNHMYYQFQDEFGYIGNTTLQNIRKGQVKNPYHRNKFGGYLGEGYFVDNPNDQLYTLWHSMIVRGTGARAMYYTQHYNEAAQYSDSMVCEEWMCYNTFATWYTKAIEKLNPNYSYEIDKDLLYPLYRNNTNGMKLYSPITCVLIPHDLNILLMDYNKYNGGNNIAGSIIELTERYHNDGALTDKTYNAIKALYYNQDCNKTYVNFRGKDYVSNAQHV